MSLTSVSSEVGEFIQIGDTVNLQMTPNDPQNDSKISIYTSSTASSCDGNFDGWILIEDGLPNSPNKLQRKP